MKFKNTITILHGCEKKISSKQLASIIAKHLVGFLPKELDAGSSVRANIDIYFSIPDTLTKLKG